MAATTSTGKYWIYFLVSTVATLALLFLHTRMVLGNTCHFMFTALVKAFDWL